MKSDIPYLDYRLEAIRLIEEFTAGGRESFSGSPLVQHATLRNLQTLAESTKRLSAARKDAHPEVPWGQITAFRNALVHEYKLDLDLIWDVVIVQSLPTLRAAVARMRVEGSMPPSPRERSGA